MNSDNKKIYDVITYNNENFFLDKEFKLIFNTNREIIGIYQDKDNLFFSDSIDNIVNEIDKFPLSKLYDNNQKLKRN
jgi:hypothetical protein